MSIVTSSCLIVMADELQVVTVSGRKHILPAPQYLSALLCQTLCVVPPLMVNIMLTFLTETGAAISFVGSTLLIQAGMGFWYYLLCLQGEERGIMT